MATNLTVQQAIETSINETRVVTLIEADEADCDELRVECDCGEGGDYWGTDEAGNSWRVRVHA